MLPKTLLVFLLIAEVSIATAKDAGNAQGNLIKPADWAGSQDTLESTHFKHRFEEKSQQNYLLYSQFNNSLIQTLAMQAKLEKLQVEVEKLRKAKPPVIYPSFYYSYRNGYFGSRHGYGIGVGYPGRYYCRPYSYFCY